MLYGFLRRRSCCLFHASTESHLLGTSTKIRDTSAFPPSLSIISRPCAKKLILLSSNIPSIRNPLPHTVLPALQYTIPTNIPNPRIRSFFLLRCFIHSFEDTLQHPHRIGLERRRPCSSFSTRSPRGRDVESMVLKKSGQEEWIPILRRSAEMFDRLCNSVGEDREKVEHQQFCNSGHSDLDLIRVALRTMITHKMSPCVHLIARRVCLQIYQDQRLVLSTPTKVAQWS